VSKPLFIYGAGGLGREIQAMLLSMPEWKLMGFYDDGINKGSACGGVACLGGLQDALAIQKPAHFILAIGNPQVKEKIAKSLELQPLIQYPFLVHPAAILLDPTSIQLGAGSVITAGCVLTTHIKIGKHSLVNINATIGHDAEIGNCCSIMPGVNLSGGVKIGDSVLIGSGASVLNKIQIETGARIGAGAVVVKSVAAKTTVVGVPAKEMEQK
jgi:sugar O-acyltransferase (sialic acid O-acetyltransferase NeuD family)